MTKLNSTIVARELSAAMERRGVGSRGLSKRVRSLIGNVRGTSYAALESYRKGQVQNPRAEVVEAAAKALRVPMLRLTTGAGPPTDEEAAMERKGRALDDDRDSEIRESIVEFSSALFPGSYYLGATTKMMLYELGVEYARILNPTRLDLDGALLVIPDLDGALRVIRDAITRPIEALGLEPANDELMTSYIRAMIFALELVPRVSRTPE